MLCNLLLNKSSFIKRCRKAGSNDAVLSQQLWLSISFNFCLIHLCVCVFYSEDLYNQKNTAVFISQWNEKILFLLGYISLYTVLSNFYLQDSWFCTKSNTCLMQSFNTIFAFFFTLQILDSFWILRIKYCFVPLFEMIIWDMA